MIVSINLKLKTLLLLAAFVMGKGLQYALDNSGNQIPINQHSKILLIGQGITYIIRAETLSLF